MKLKTLDSFESINSQELQFVVGGALSTGSECWEDSMSKDSYKKILEAAVKEETRLK